MSSWNHFAFTRGSLAAGSLQMLHCSQQCGRCHSPDSDMLHCSQQCGRCHSSDSDMFHCSQQWGRCHSPDSDMLHCSQKWDTCHSPDSDMLHCTSVWQVSAGMCLSAHSSRASVIHQIQTCFTAHIRVAGVSWHMLHCS